MKKISIPILAEEINCLKEAAKRFNEGFGAESTTPKVSINSKSKLLMIDPLVSAVFAGFFLENQVPETMMRRINHDLLLAHQTLCQQYPKDVTLSESLDHFIDANKNNESQPKLNLVTENTLDI